MGGARSTENGDFSWSAWIANMTDSFSLSEELVLEAGRAERHYWRDIWAYRELFYILAWRDVAVRYKQTVIGILWAIVRPFITMVIFTIVFSRLAKLPSESAAPYPVMVFAGMLPWFLFSTILNEASISLIGNANLVGKIYFPRIIIPTSSAVVALVDFAINLAILFGNNALVWFCAELAYRSPARFRALAVLASLGPAFLITALNVKYRDFRYIIPFIFQFGLYVSPVGFSARSSLIVALLVQSQSRCGRHRRLSLVHPGRKQRALSPGFLSLGVVALFLWLGIAYFRQTERSFADLI